ncbi:CocE/NonD family hydrolase [Marinilongibacter aquaticus]|uniref:CocE/NonD family hydrolase n=1 Tax=Marinilongibacter aquaticus TaxID=2975157 RepID=UPI0021BD39A8|nr:CocE/NonD family hydrolase [Marinilongibacter aquaticus]UBM58785.1 CocE/NonD family hydrolase [Marinilongibacter aquaticus]
MKSKHPVRSRELLSPIFKFLIILASLSDCSPSLAQQKFPLPDSLHYWIQDSVLIPTGDGAILSAVVVGKKGVQSPLPTAFQFSIYSNLSYGLSEAKFAADRGYVGVIADARGKRLSPDNPRPYETEHSDVNAVLDWIVEQPWSNGEVGMYGGSYLGFAQWASLKSPHPALKTIVPYVAAIPGQGLPMENNIFLLANYQWAFYVTNNKLLDHGINRDFARWNRLRQAYWNSGAPFSRIDSLDGTPNPWFHCWLNHPSYDRYWQSMVPYKEDFSKIKIPVLSITGYYDDGQISAIQYLKDHMQYNPKAEHYLIIGPYDHFGAQRGGTRELRSYRVDSVALINTHEITYAWLDYILKGGKKPSILQDKINFEVMGKNEWKGAARLDELEPFQSRFYLCQANKGRTGMLSLQKPSKESMFTQVVDFSGRDSYYFDYYPNPIIKDQIDESTGFLFTSQPFAQPISIGGNLKGELGFSINKKDVDVGLILYELTPDGKYFQLSYFMGRASYMKDPASRNLLQENRTYRFNFDKSRYFSKQLQPGSRLVVALNIVMNPFSQINYGTGKDVSLETIRDAGEPLRISWSNLSFIELGSSRKPN